MPSIDDPFRLAATLAIDLMKESKGLDERKAADIAWQTWKDADAVGSKPIFQVEQNLERLVRLMSEIRDGRTARAEHSPWIWQKALEQLARS